MSLFVSPIEQYNCIISEHMAGIYQHFGQKPKVSLGQAVGDIEPVPDGNAESHFRSEVVRDELRSVEKKEPLRQERRVQEARFNVSRDDHCQQLFKKELFQWKTHTLLLGMRIWIHL